MDVDGIRPGENFVEKLDHMVSSCDAMLVVIGKHWITVADKRGLPRLKDARDYVRLEVGAALKRKIPVIPVLVSGATIPQVEDLPRDIARLAHLQAVELHDARFIDDLSPLIKTLESLFAGVGKGIISDDREDARIVERPLNLGFDGAVHNGFPYGWFDSAGFVSGVATDYTVKVIPRNDRTGHCLVLQKQNADRAEFGSIMQRFPAGFLAGRTVKLEGDLHTENVENWAGLWLRADGLAAADLFFDNMSGQQLSGTTDWKKYSLEGHLPSTTAWLNFGVVLCGKGVLWADNIRMMVWNRDGIWEDV